MRQTLSFLIFLGAVSLAQSPVAKADPVPPSWEDNRLSGFYEHKRENDVFEKERLKGEKAFLEEQEQWERERQAAIAAYKKEVKVQSPAEGGPEHKAYLREVARQEDEYKKIEAEYRRMKAAMTRQTAKKKLVSEEEEYDLIEKRPRFDVTKRELYGKPSKYQSGSRSGFGGSSSYGGGSGISRDSGRFQSSPPPASFGDGEDGPPMQDGDILPPPTFDDSIRDAAPGAPLEYDDLPPPPPPEFDPDDLPPPPDFGDFPPPPPPLDY